MPESLAIALPLVMASVLFASGIAKLQHPDTLAGWTELGVPAWLRRSWTLRIHPWGELALGGVLALFGGWLGFIGALVSLTLMATYLVLVLRVVGRGDDPSCACFGAAKPVTRVTVIRNLWLTILSAGVVGVIWLNPLLGGAVATAAGTVGAWAWVVGLAIAGLTVTLILWPEVDRSATSPPSADSMALAGAEDDDLDYIRTRTPAVPVTLSDGQVVNLRHLTTRKPVLLLAVSETCGPCQPVIESIGGWRERLPEIDIRFLLTTEPGVGELTDSTEPQSLHDPHGYVSGSIEDWPTPTAVLFGIDGLLAGGPVTGKDRIPTFIDDVYASLHDDPNAVELVQDATLAGR